MKTETGIWKRNLTGLDRDGKFRSLNGAADENIFIGKASKAGFFCFFKVWRDMPYDAVVDSAGILLRIEVKGSSTDSFNVTRGGRSGKQIDRSVMSRERLINREDCDFVVCVDSNNGDCYIIPIDIIIIYNRNLLRKNAIKIYREKWELFSHGKERLAGEQIRDGLMGKSEGEVYEIASRLNINIPIEPYAPSGTKNFIITDRKEKAIVLIWESMCFFD